jgi:prepilin-type N-terminal cleavage/methylation domain-containing protein
MTPNLADGTSCGMRAYPRNGYTLIEIVVALFLFSVGGLALAGTSAVVGRELNLNASRERAARIATTRIEMLRAGCRSAGSGREKLGRIESEWSVGFSDASNLSVTESITYPTKLGARTDLYRVRLPCPP